MIRPLIRRLYNRHHRYDHKSLKAQIKLLILSILSYSPPAPDLNMDSSVKKVILIGAGGNLGPSILSAFDVDEGFTVSILARHSSNSTFPAHLKVHRIGDDYPEAELVAAFKGQDAVISTIATANAVQQKKMVDAAVKAGVKRFVPSEFGSDTLNEKAVTILPQYFKGKREAVEYLKTKEEDGLIWTAFVTGPFFEL